RSSRAESIGPSSSRCGVSPTATSSCTARQCHGPGGERRYPSRGAGARPARPLEPARRPTGPDWPAPARCPPTESLSKESTVLVAIIVIVVVVLLVAFLVWQYNGLVRLRNRVEGAWAQIDVQLKRRYDLIPNLVETVKG